MTDKHQNNFVFKKLKAKLIVAAIGTVIVTVMAACSNSSTTQNTAANESGDIKTSNSSNQTAVNNKSEQNPTMKTTLADGKPIYYNVNNWALENRGTYSYNNLKKMQSVLGEVVSTDDNSLDYASNPAIKYRFMNNDEPYFDIIDSQYYFEFGWYYANPDDSKEQKKTSIAHAKKVYQVAYDLMGDAGGDLVSKILTGQVVKGQQVGDLYIELAKCEFYSCMLIIKKDTL